MKTQLNLAADAPAQFKGEPLPDPAKVTAKLTVTRDLATKKQATFQPSLTPDVPDDRGNLSLF